MLLDGAVERVGSTPYILVRYLNVLLALIPYIFLGWPLMEVWGRGSLAKGRLLLSHLFVYRVAVSYACWYQGGLACTFSFGF